MEDVLSERMCRKSQLITKMHEKTVYRILNMVNAQFAEHSMRSSRITTPWCGKKVLEPSYYDSANVRHYRRRFEECSEDHALHTGGRGTVALSPFIMVRCGNYFLLTFQSFGKALHTMLEYE